jgi:predicted thioesterase
MKRTLILLLSLAPAALGQDLTGRFERGTRYEEPAAHAPANVSRMFSRNVPRIANKASIDIPAAGGSGMIVWAIPSSETDAPLKTRLGAPGVRRFTMDAAGELGIRGRHEVMHVSDAAGSYRLDIDVPHNVERVMVVVAEPDSRVVLSTWAAPLSRQSGEPVTLHAELRDGEQAISGAAVTARLVAPNGRTFDSIALVETATGVYRATFAELPLNVPGAWQVRFDAEGVTGNGASFARTGSGELMAERGAARLGQVRAVVVGDVLRVSAPADVVEAGAYRFDVQIADDDRNALAWGEAVRRLERGAAALSIDIPLAHLAGTPVGNLFLDVRLLGLDTIGVAGRVTMNVD